MSRKNLVLYIKLARPIFLLGAALQYALGVGIARYLGHQIDWGIYFLGQAWVTMLQLSTQFLNEYFNSPADMDNPNRTLFSGGSGAIGPGKLTRRTALFSALACLAVVASLTVLIIQIQPAPATYLIMALAFLGAFFYSTPPISLEQSGYGELVTSLLVAYMVPAFGYLLQVGELHRLLAMATLPLAVLHLAMLLAFEIPDYATDVKYEKRTLFVRLGWQNGMFLHNLLILSAFLLVGIALIAGRLPQFAALPALLLLPLGLLQIWQIRRISQGFKPNWSSLTLVAVALFAATAYMVTFAFWTH